MNRFSYYETNDISLAAGLLALGIPVNEETPFVRLKGQYGEIYKFFFQERSIDGRYQTGAMIAAWKDDNFHVENPEHPFSYIKCAFKNREGLLDTVKQAVELVVLEKNGKLVIVSKNASKELQKEIFEQL